MRIDLTTMSPHKNRPNSDGVDATNPTRFICGQIDWPVYASFILSNHNKKPFLGHLKFTKNNLARGIEPWTIIVKYNTILLNH